MGERAGAMGWGYQGHTPDQLREVLSAWRATALVDVRLNPVSRKPGFSRKALGALCQQAGVQYMHLPDLGNPRDNREGFAATGDDRRAAHERYNDEVLGSDDARAALKRLAELTGDGLVVVLCFEAVESCCHRSLVLDALRHELVSA